LAWYFKVAISSEQKRPIKSESQLSKLDNLIGKIDNSLTVEHGGLTKLIDFSEIYYLKASGNYVEIFCHSEKYLKRITLKQLLLKLPARNFFQVHRSHIVNMEKISKLNNTETGTGLLILDNNQSLSVSKKFKSALKNKASTSS